MTELSLLHLFSRLRSVETRVRAAVARTRATDPDPNDPFKGLYLTEEAVDRLLGGGPRIPIPLGFDHDADGRAIEEMAMTAEAAGEELRLLRLARSFDLEPLDVELLLIALAPDLDVRFERLYGYLHDDLTRRRASVGLAFDLCGISPADGRSRARLQPGSPLVDGHLVTIEDADRPFLTRSLRVPDRVAGHLLNDDTPDAALHPLLELAYPWRHPETRRLATAINAGVRLVYLRETTRGTGEAFGAAAMMEAGLRPLMIRLDAFDTTVAGQVGALARREAQLSGAGLLAASFDSIVDRARPAVRHFTEGCSTILVGSRRWDPTWSSEVPLQIEVPVPTVNDRRAFWNEAVGNGARNTAAIDLVAPLRLAPAQVERAVDSARLQGLYRGREPQLEDFVAGARGQNSAGLERLARRIVPQVGWDDLVLPPNTLGLLQDLASRAHHRDLVLNTWGMRKTGAQGTGITALFAGDSGTGKTMAAEVIAFELGLDLYTIDLSTVVDKYIGETEKNLERVFEEAEGVNGVLFFDEADALFGKRSGVSDSRDRYANMEVAYLLQRVERFDGIALLATNLRANLDDAFARRLDLVVEFPVPDEDARRRLWERCLGSTLPRAEDIDIALLARRFQLVGGDISSATMTAAYRAAATLSDVRMSDLLDAVQQEYKKLGRLFNGLSDSDLASVTTSPFDTAYTQSTATQRNGI